jgi:hypothetical protein
MPETQGSTHRVKPPFNRPNFSTVFYHRTYRPQRPDRSHADDILHGAAAGATNQHITGILDELQIPAAGSDRPVTARVPLNGESQQWVGAAIEELAHRALFVLPVKFSHRETTHTFVDRMRTENTSSHVATGRSTRHPKGALKLGCKGGSRSTS